MASFATFISRMAHDLFLFNINHVAPSSDGDGNV